MSLTAEQTAAFHAAVNAAAADSGAGWYEEREAIFLAGIAYGRKEGAADMRERVAKWHDECERKCREQKDHFAAVEHAVSATRIRALPGEAP